jgi:EpsG family
MAVFLPALARPKKFKPLASLYVIIVPLIYIIGVFLLRDFNRSNDFQNYLYIYSVVVTSDDLFSRNGEFLFNIFLIIGNALGVSYEFVYSALMLVSTIVMFFSLYLSKIEFDEKLIFLLFIFSSSGTYFLLANAFRQGLALNLLVAVVVASSHRGRLIAAGLAPLFHFSSLLPILSITAKKLFSSKFAMLFLVVGLFALVPLFQILVFYRLEKYTEEYDYESSFQILRLGIDLFALLFLIVNKNKFTNLAAPIVFFAIKILAYNFSPLIYSRVSYYDVVMYFFVYLNCQIRERWWVRLLVILMAIIYANLIFSIESLNSNFEFLGGI